MDWQTILHPQKHTSHNLCSNKELNWDTSQVQNTHHTLIWNNYQRTAPGQSTSLCF